METIITIVGSLTLVTQLIVEFIKTLYNKNTTLVAFIVAQVVTWVAFYFKAFQFDYLAIVIIGLAVGLASTTGFDKVKQVIENLKFK